MTWQRGGVVSELSYVFDHVLILECVFFHPEAVVCNVLLPQHITGSMIGAGHEWGMGALQPTISEKFWLCSYPTDSFDEGVHYAK